tara:strand:+ start:89 stop:1411 length:1323 start_codon:yes stop_codon:yes gene_type:complete
MEIYKGIRMTAEIAVINKSAIALAADSAVSISDGNGSTKVYNGAEKLFALTKYQPVGIMIYGTGSLCRVPWELVIKEYRKRIKDASFETLDAYAEDFFKFLEDEPNLIPRDYREHFVRMHWQYVYNQIWTIVDTKVARLIEEGEDEPSLGETYELLDAEITKVCSIFHQNDFLNNFTEDDVRAIKVECKQFLEDHLISEASKKDFPPKSIELASDLLALATAKENPLGSNSGVVFAGYGNSEYFPSILAFNLKGFWRDKLRVIPNKEKSAIAGSSGIQAYAQDEEALTFMHGISPFLESDIKSQYQSLFQNVLVAVDNFINETSLSKPELKEFKDKLVTSTQELWNETNESISTLIRKKYTDQVVDMVEFLPKDELAYMAESLVNMTAFKRKVTNDTETVGGPIDVAIISKGDGFVWIRRKHYFDSELNSHYFSNFLKGK